MHVSVCVTVCFCVQWECVSPWAVGHITRFPCLSFNEASLVYTSHLPPYSELSSANLDLHMDYIMMIMSVYRRVSVSKTPSIKTVTQEFGLPTISLHISHKQIHRKRPFHTDLSHKKLINDIL